MSQVESLIDTLEATGEVLVASTAVRADEGVVHLLCEFKSSLAELRAQCRELSMMNQLLRERLEKSLDQTRKLSGTGSPIAHLHGESGELREVDPRR